MSGFTVSLYRRRYCEAGGKELARYWRALPPGQNGIAKCPVCGKGVTLREVDGKPSVIPRHVERVVGL